MLSDIRLPRVPVLCVCCVLSVFVLCVVLAVLHIFAPLPKALAEFVTKVGIIQNSLAFQVSCVDEVSATGSRQASSKEEKVVVEPRRSTGSEDSALSTGSSRGGLDFWSKRMKDLDVGLDKMKTTAYSVAKSANRFHKAALPTKLYPSYPIPITAHTSRCSPNSSYSLSWNFFVIVMSICVCLCSCSCAFVAVLNVKEPGAE